VFKYVLRLLFAFHFFWAWYVTDSAVEAAEFTAIVEQDGTVAHCLSNGSLLFADRCEGNGRLSIVQPIKEGEVVLRFATGTIALANDSKNEECALSHAKWDSKVEEAISTEKKVTKVDRAGLLKRLKTFLLKDVDATESDVSAFGLDLDGDGKEEIVFVISNLDRLADHDPNSKPVPYFVFAGVQKGDSAHPPALFHSEQGEYYGGTDAIGDVTIKGIVPIAPETGEIALLVKTSPALIGSQMLVRYRSFFVQRIDTIQFICN
jgi:hypothetical protein